MVLLTSQESPSPDRGFALLVVLWVVAILSAVSFALIASARGEARNASEAWDRLIGERLARSGQEIELYLRYRGLGSAVENLSGLPVDVQVPGFQYTVRLPEGAIDLYLESDAGKINLSMTNVQLVQNFLTQWKGDTAVAVSMVEAVKEWGKQNSRMAIATLPLLPGLTPDDLQPKPIKTSSTWTVRESLDQFVTTAAAGADVNPNFAPKIVLQSVPGLSEEQVAALLEARTQGGFFKDADELRARLGLAADNPAMKYFRFDRGLTPAVLTIARHGSGRSRLSERRVYELMPSFNAATGGFDSAIRLHRVEFDRLPEFIQK